MTVPTVAEKIASEIEARIIGGELLPGSPLRQEVFVQEFGASHAAVREAFLRLEGRRLVIGEARRGFRVMTLEPGGSAKL